MTPSKVCARHLDCGRRLIKRSIDKNFLGAAKLYGEAIEKNDQDATIWCNRAFARMNLASFHLIVSMAYLFDCRKSLDMRWMIVQRRCVSQ